MVAARVVVRAPNWLGDIVMALPAIAAIRQALAGSHLAVAMPAPFAALGRAIAGVDAVVPLEGAGARGLRGHAAALAAGRFDLGILLTNSFASALAMRLAGIPERWGVARDLRRPLLTRAVGRPGRDAVEGLPVAPEHHAAYYLAVLRGLDIPPVPGPFAIAVPEPVRARGRERLEAGGWTPGTPLVGLAPGAAYGQAKRWPPEQAAEAVAALAEGGVRVVLVGAPSDRAAAEALREALPAGAGAAAPPLDLVGRTDLADLMGVLSWCRVVVSNDSGAMHLSASIGRPVVALFGPTNERRTAPIGERTILTHPVWCRPCLLRECPIDHRCLRRIGAGRVVAAVRERLAATEPARP